MAKTDDDPEIGSFCCQNCDWSDLNKYAVDINLIDSDFRLLYILKMLNDTGIIQAQYRLIAQKAGLTPHEAYSRIVILTEQGYIKRDSNQDSRAAQIRENLFAASIKTDSLLQKRQDKLRERYLNSPGQTKAVHKQRAEAKLKPLVQLLNEVDTGLKREIERINSLVSTREREDALMQLRCGRDCISKISKTQLSKYVDLIDIKINDYLETKLTSLEARYSAMRWIIRGLYFEYAVDKVNGYPTTPEGNVEKWWRECFLDKYTDQVCPTFTFKERAKARQLYADYKETEIKQGFYYIIKNWQELKSDKKYNWNNLTKGLVPDIRLFFIVQNQLMPEIRENMKRSVVSNDVPEVGGVFEW